MSDPESKADPAPAPASPEAAAPPHTGQGPTWTSAVTRASGSASPPTLAPGRNLVDRYTVLDLLGQGGMGTVLAAYDARLDRRVALKLLRPHREHLPEGTQGKGRLVREAQAMARLNHPHVVAVYDAGWLEDGSVFIAMEYVQGQTLRRWCRQAPRTWREVLRAWLAAGRGLAAAHAAGLVHRDFKPDNVLVGEDGRVRVTDFGLARFDTSPLPTPTPAGPPPPGALDGPLTLPGSFVGTPAYMAPELLEGQPADVRSDVYAFCVSLYEALYGQLPFAAQDIDSLRRARREGRVAPPPADSQVPPWVLHALLEGLRPEASRRPPSLEPLLRRLEEDDPQARRRSRPQALALAATLLVLVALAAWAWGRHQGPGCARLEQRLAGVWDAAVGQRVRQALLATGLSYAPPTAERVASALDAYARAWVRQRVELCEASGPRPQGLALLQESCLERRRSQLRALTELLARGPDKELVGRAVQAAQALPPLDYCAEARALTAAVPPPEDPQVRARAEALDEEVDRLEALYEAGKYQDGLGLGGALLPRVETLGHAPLEARTGFLLARLRESTGDFPGAERQARQALEAAARGKDLVRVAQAWGVLTHALGLQGRYPEALPLLAAVDTSVQLASDEPTRALADTYLGSLLLAVGRHQEGRERLERALALRERLLGPEHPQVVGSLQNLASALMSAGRFEEALARYTRTRVLWARALGDSHPNLGHAHNNLGTALRELGRLEEARGQFASAAALWEGALGPTHPHVAIAQDNLGMVLRDLGRYAQARLQHERALALRERLLGTEHPQVATSLHNLGLVLADEGQHPQALERCQRALALRERRLGPEHRAVTDSLVCVGRVLTRLGRPAEARRHLERAVASTEKSLGPDSPVLVHALVELAEALRAEGRAAAAVPLLERALGLCLEWTRAEARLALARALWEARLERPRALALASEALEHWRRLGHQPRLEEASRWLATHTGPRAAP